MQESAEAPQTTAERARTHHLLALALSGQGRFEAALAEIEAADRLAAGNPEVQRAYGNILLKQGRAGDAVGRYRRAIELAESFRARTGMAVPDLHRWRYELAQALLQSGHEDEARAELALYERLQAEEIELRNFQLRAEDQGTPAAQHELAAALRRVGRREEAARLLRSIVAAHPGFAAAHVELATLMAETAVQAPSSLRRSLLELAARHARQAIEHGESVEAWLALARAERLRGNEDVANDSIDKARALSRNDSATAELIEEIRRLAPERDPR